MNPFTESTIAKPLSPFSTPEKISWCCRHKRRAIRFVSGAAFLIGALTPTLSFAIDINQASIEDLQSLKGIGPKTAQMIIEERIRGGEFDSLEDLSDRVKGIGPKKVDSLAKSGLTVSNDKRKTNLPAD